MTFTDDFSASPITGTLDHNLCNLTVLGSDFIGTGTFELEVTVTKDNRSSTGAFQIERLEYDPPLLKMA